MMTRFLGELAEKIMERYGMCVHLGMVLALGILVTRIRFLHAFNAFEDSNLLVTALVVIMIYVGSYCILGLAYLQNKIFRKFESHDN